MNPLTWNFDGGIPKTLHGYRGSFKWHPSDSLENFNKNRPKKAMFL